MIDDCPPDGSTQHHPPPRHHSLRIMTPLRSLHASLIFLLVSCTHAGSALSPRRVLVSGAGGQTGSRVLKLLESKPETFSAVGLVRTEESKASLPETSEVVVGSITDPAALKECMSGCDALIICTSATPKPSSETTPEGRPIFGFPNGQPEEVDWIGQKNQIDAAQKAGVSHVVICGSMGGTNPGNMLNSIGKGDDGKGGNILLWKRKAEDYLMKSGLIYTIVHPGGLVNEPGGLRELVVGVDDSQEGTDNRNIPRDDVARVLVASLEQASFAKRSFDVRSKPEGEGSPTADFSSLLDRIGDANCDYSLGEIP